jgi:hypothetical protein
LAVGLRSRQRKGYTTTVGEVIIDPIMTGGILKDQLLELSARVVFPTLHIPQKTLIRELVRFAKGQLA